LLPVAHASANNGAETKKANAQSGRDLLSGNALIVDDETMVGEFMGELLEQWGLDVTVENSPLNALQLVKTNPLKYSVLITDQTMPKMTGFDLARSVTRLNPELPIILYTGYSDTLSESKVLESGIKGYLKKPLDFDKLQTLLANLLQTETNL
jgi:DNA-binding NtrC family response regulator